MTTYLVHGFRREDTKQRVCMLVDRGNDPSTPVHAIAGQVAGPEFCFHAGENVSPSVVVPEDAKRILFMSDEELYARVPELDWRRKSRRRRSRK